MLFRSVSQSRYSAKLIEYDAIIDSFSNTFIQSGKKYITADIARYGSDKAVLMVWDGFKVIKIKSFDKSSVTLLSNEIKDLSNEFRVPMSQIICDEDGVGGGVVDILNCKGFVNGSRAIEEKTDNPNENEIAPQYQNLKSQCYFKLAYLINNSGLFISETEHKESVIEELEQMKRNNVDKGGKLSIIPKEKVVIVTGKQASWLL